MKFLLYLIIFMSGLTQAEDIFTNEFEPLIATRISNMELRDPHIYAELGFFGCQDVTDSFMGQDGVNPIINQSISSDGEDADDFLDLSLVTQYNTDQPSYLVDRSLTTILSEADCAIDISCEFTPGALPTTFTSQTQTSGVCLDVMPGTTSGYTPTISTTQSPCHVTNPQNVTLDLDGIVIILQEYQQALRYQGGIATDQGLHRGFLDQVTAESIILPADLPFVGGNTLASVLSGHPGNCDLGNDMDVHPTLGDGWWMYFNSTSDLIELL